VTKLAKKPPMSRKTSALWIEANLVAEERTQQ
jgi:hypothetical protein